MYSVTHCNILGIQSGPFKTLIEAIKYAQYLISGGCRHVLIRQVKIKLH